MNLMRFKGTDDAVKLIIRFSAGYCIILAIAFTNSTVFLINKTEKAYGQALVIDRQGEVYEASSLSTSNMRQYEYMSRVETFITHWYTSDGNSCEKNISFAPNLIGDKGKELLNECDDVNMLNLLIQKSTCYGVHIRDVEVNTQTIPVFGRTIFTQIGCRARGSISHNIGAEFTIHDMSFRNEENAHGVKIENWIARYPEPVEGNGANTSQAAFPDRNKNQSETSKSTNYGTE